MNWKILKNFNVYNWFYLNYYLILTKLCFFENIQESSLMLFEEFRPSVLPCKTFLLFSFQKLLKKTFQFDFTKAKIILIWILTLNKFHKFTSTYKDMHIWLEYFHARVNISIVYLDFVFQCVNLFNYKYKIYNSQVNVFQDVCTIVRRQTMCGPSQHFIQIYIIYESFSPILHGVNNHK